MINTEYRTRNVVFSSDTSITLSPLHLGTMYELHALYKTVVMHNGMEQNATSSNELRATKTFLRCPLSHIQTHSIAGSSHYGAVVCSYWQYLDIFVEIQTRICKVKSAIQSSPVLTRDTCVVSSWPTELLDTAM